MGFLIVLHKTHHDSVPFRPSPQSMQELNRSARVGCGRIRMQPINQLGEAEVVVSWGA